MLNSLNRFFIPSLSPAMFNVATIVCVIGLVPVMPRFGMPGIMAMAIATLLGGAGQIALQWPLLRKEGFRYRPIVDFRDPALREVLRLMIPGTLGLAAVQINVVVNTYLAASQPEGAVSWLMYAFRLMYLPIGLFGVSVATAALPQIARHSAADDLASIRRTISSAIRMMLMLNMPATIGLIVLADPVVSLIFERGAFSASDTQATAAALMFYAPGLIGYSAVKIASPTFYSLGDSRTPVVVSVAAVAVNLSLNLALVRVLGFRGLALGTAIAALFNAIALLWLLRRRLGGLDERRIAIALLKIGAAALAMAAAALIAHGWLERVAGGPGETRRALRVLGAIVVALVTLAGAARILRIREFEEAYNLIARRLLPARR
jgi:putative peptidoglycan lipid II flippase